ncbi:hypothetical protein [Mesorhizobium sp. KR9-304]|uniref:hypothetical protein n=1 Tax=Mesorhizobium sp. KR9-304 TaxID=3156614 RepID=UPI0032B4CCC0
MDSDEKPERSKGRRKAGEDHQKKWLSEHFPYEVCMMRYGLTAMRGAIMQIDYNLAFECFVSKARVIYSFLTNKAQHNDDIQAADFTSTYPPPSIEKVKNIISRWNAHAAHASNKRPDSVAEKIDLEDCIKMAGWIEKALVAFLAAVPERMRENWSGERAGDMLPQIAGTVTFQSTFSASSAAPVIVKGMSTATNHIRLSDGDDSGT